MVPISIRQLESTCEMTCNYAYVSQPFCCKKLAYQYPFFFIGTKARTGPRAIELPPPVGAINKGQHVGATLILTAENPGFKDLMFNERVTW